MLIEVVVENLNKMLKGHNLKWQEERIPISRIKPGNNNNSNNNVGSNKHPEVNQMHQMEERKIVKKRVIAMTTAEMMQKGQMTVTTVDCKNLRSNNKN